MLNICLWKNTEYRFSIRSIVYIVTREEVIHHHIHLFVSQLLTIRDSCMTRKAKGNLMIDRQAIVGDGYCRSYYVLYQLSGIQPLNTSRNTIDGVARRP